MTDQTNIDKEQNLIDKNQNVIDKNQNAVNKHQNEVDTENNQRMINDRIQRNLMTIDVLLEQGKFASSVGKDGHWKLTPLLHRAGVDVGIVTVGDTSDPCVDHIHELSKEYLIVISGRVLLSIDGVTIRVVDQGECASIPKGAIHHSQALLPNTELIYVCVPADPGMVELSERMQHGR